MQQLLRLSLPGIDELAALLEMLRFGRMNRYDVVIVDTAPTGHTLRMLAMPETLSAIAHVFDDMQAKHRAMVEALRGAWIEDAADALIAGMSRDARTLAGLLRDPDSADLTLVSLPEMMAVEETVDAARSLMESEIPIARVVVNRVTPPPPERCRWCEARRREESGAVAVLASRLRALVKSGGGQESVISAVRAREREPVGVGALQQVARELNERPAPSARGKLRRAKRDAARRSASRTIQYAEVPVPKLQLTARGSDGIRAGRLLMFGGKGGVGKTTCAAAAALHLAGAEPRRHVLLVSTDPAHSLADVLRTPVSDVPARVPHGPGNLRVRELDAFRVMEPIRAQYATSIDALFDRLARGTAFDAAHDRRVMHDLLDLAPPGLDELAAVLNLVNLLSDRNPEIRSSRAGTLRPEGDRLAEDRFDTIVMDTAPTGHALRLLQMPGTVQDWTKALMSILLKYQPVAGIGEVGAALLGLSRGLGRLRVLLSNPEQTRFVVVTRAAALPRAETARLVESLRRLRIAVAAVIVNAAGAGTCTRCRAAERRERIEMQLLDGIASSMSLIVAPATVPAPLGPQALDDWRKKWRTLA